MKRKEPGYEIRKLPYLRIEVSELLKILERVAAGRYKITAETSSFEFESLEEMSAQKGQLCHDPTILNGPVEFKSSHSVLEPELGINLIALRHNEGSEATEQAKNLMDALEKELIHYKSPLSNPMTRTIASIVFSIFSVVLYLFYTTPSTEIDAYFWVGFIMALLIPSQIANAIMKKAVGLSTIYYQPRETWLQRHSSELLAGSVSGAVGASIGAIVTYFLTKQ